MERTRTLDPALDGFLPYPLAVAWHDVAVRTRDRRRLEYAKACLEVLCRTLASFTVADYLRGPPTDEAESALRDLDSPPLGKWDRLIQETLRAIAGRAEPRPFLNDCLSWYFKSGRRKSRDAQALQELVALRNTLEHKGKRSPSKAADLRKKLVADLESLLRRLRWLSRYPLLRVLDGKPLRGGGFGGHVQLLVGRDHGPDPKEARWTAPHLPDGVYLVSPEWDALLSLWPLLRPGSTEARADSLLLFRGTRKDQFVVTELASGDESRAPVRLNDRWLRFSEWLAARDSHDRFHSIGDPHWLRAVATGEAARPYELDRRFHVLGVLGEGGMARVYEVEDRWDEGQYALKVLHRRYSEDPVFRQRFYQEAWAMRSVSHRAVLEVHDFRLPSDGPCWLKLTALPGASLADRIAKGPVPLEQVRAWALDLLEALEVLDDRGIVHRDVKPSNILLDDQDRVYLADFGIARREEDPRLTAPSERLGSLAYAAPEQSRTGDTTHRSDLFSLGLVLDSLAKGREEPTAPGDGVAKPLGPLIRWMTQRSPEHRPTAREAHDYLANRELEPEPGEPEPARWIPGPVALDLGSCNTVVAWVDPGQHAGWDPDSWRPAAACDLPTHRVLHPDPGGALDAYLGDILRRVTEDTAHRIANVVLCVPTSMTAEDRQGLREAVTRALGDEVTPGSVRLVPEPVALLTWSLLGRLHRVCLRAGLRPLRVAVVDAGARATRVSLCSIEGNAERRVVRVVDARLADDAPVRAAALQHRPGPERDRASAELAAGAAHALAAALTETGLSKLDALVVGGGASRLPGFARRLRQACEEVGCLTEAESKGLLWSERQCKVGFALGALAFDLDSRLALG